MVNLLQTLWYLYQSQIAGTSLLWVGALGLVVMYIYSVGTFALLANEFHEPDPEEDGDNVRFCRSLIQCFISVLEYGLLDTLGLVSQPR